ncbi:MAG TPA: DUF1697 domain-containing protein [Gemmatimonadales bacterium]|nr:DUF1697 domain-containing protein [Gemmatimonadales bacterium]
MAAFAALLRAVNVGGRNPVAMPALRDLLEELGFTDVKSLLQSGNVTFRGDGRRGAALEALLAGAAARRLAVSTEFFVRTAAEWRSLVARNPFPAEAERDPGRLLVLFLKKSPRRSAVQALQNAITGPEVVRAAGKHAYIVYPNGTGRSRLTNAVIERHLGSPSTGRNWNTVLKLGALLAE